MTGFYPKLEPHEIDTLGALGRRIQATIDAMALPTQGELESEIEYLEDENRGLLGVEQLYQRAFEELLEIKRLPRTAREIIEKALEDGKDPTA